MDWIQWAKDRLSDLRLYLFPYCRKFLGPQTSSFHSDFPFGTLRISSKFFHISGFRVIRYITLVIVASPCYAPFNRPFPEASLSSTQSLWHFALKAQHTAVSYANARSVSVLQDAFYPPEQCLIRFTPQSSAHACFERCGVFVVYIPYIVS